MSGLLARDIVGNHYGFAHLTVRTRLATLSTAPQGGGLYVGFSLEGGNAWDDAQSVRLGDLKGAASVFAGVETLLGPLFLSYGRTTSGDDKVYLLLGLVL
jgi:NTE family protein